MQIDKAEIIGLDYAARGVAKIDGKAIFVDYALPHEIVKLQIYNNKKNYAQAHVLEIIKPSEHRIKTACPHFYSCGGCALQHLKYEEQLNAKKQIWFEQCQKFIGNLPHIFHGIIPSCQFNYRIRAKLAVQYSNNDISIGFKKKLSNDIIEIKTCPILNNDLNNILSKLKVIARKFKYKIKEIILVKSKNTIAINLLINNDINNIDITKLENILDNNTQLWINNKIFYGNSNDLFYQIDDYKIHFTPDDFIQINPFINQQLIEIVKNNTDDEYLLDLFSGLGNFAIPLAQNAKHILTVEVVDNMVNKARDIAKKNNLEQKISQMKFDLFKPNTKLIKKFQQFQTWILDPPRAGALELVRTLNKTNSPQKIIYISCNPASFARDAKIIQNAGFIFEQAWLADMFANTHHMETIAIFKKAKNT